MHIRNKRDIISFVSFVGILGLVLVNCTNWYFLQSDAFWNQVLLSNAQVAIMTLTIAPYFALKMLQVTELSQELEFALNHDHLTRVSTRAHMERRLKSELLWPAAVVVCDLDHFKKVNDTYGHQVGDLVLQHFAKIASSHMRATDIVARFGGEEFVIVLPHSQAQGAMRLTQDLCDALTAHPLAHKGNLITVTASFGVAIADTPDAFATALSQADKALYEAKATGRNKVVPAQSVAPSLERRAS